MARDGRKQLSLRLSPEQKAEWDAYVDESPKVNTLSELMRRSVSQYIATDGDMGAPTDRNSAGGGGDDYGPELLDEIRRLKNGHVKIHDRLDVLAEELRSSPSRSTFTDDAFEILPESEAEAMTFEEVTAEVSGDMAASEQIYMVLESLADNTSIVRRTDDGTQTRYYKNV